MKNQKTGWETDRSRRGFLRSAGIGAASLAAIPALVRPDPMQGSLPTDSGVSGKALRKFFARDDVVLLQGDSITDAGREKKEQLPNNARSFGPGYAYIIAAVLLDELADYGLKVYNRGISGNKVFQLADRWQEDCLDLKPDVLSILIGVNDYWHMRNGRYDGTPEIYERDYRNLLERTRTALPDVRLVICQPYILTGTSAVDETWIEPFRVYQEIAAKIAREFGAVWVPFQSAYTEATAIAPATYWTRDGVHPAIPGCELMAETWLRAVSLSG